MPQFFFDIDDGERQERDTIGLDLENPDAARATAITALPDLAREELPDGDRRVFICKVRNSTSQVIFIATLSLVAEWINDGGVGGAH